MKCAWCDKALGWLNTDGNITNMHRDCAKKFQETLVRMARTFIRGKKE